MKYKHIEITIKYLLTLMLLATLYGVDSKSYAQSLVPYNNPCTNGEGWRMVWQDDFDYLDTTKWEVVNEADHYGKIPSVNINDNVNVVNGKLKLDMKKGLYQCAIENNHSKWECRRQCALDSALAFGGPNPYYYKFTSGQIGSKCNFNFTYGYTEARIKFPTNFGTWSSYWLYTNPCNATVTGAEIDIIEIWGKDMWTSEGIRKASQIKDVYKTNFWACYEHDVTCLGSDPTNVRSQEVKLPNGTLDSYHIFGCYWTPAMVYYFLDGNLVESQPNTGNGIHNGNHEPIQIIFDLWADEWMDMQNNYSKVSNSTISMYVDWVRVFKQKAPFVSDGKAPWLLNPDDDANIVGKKQVEVLWQLPTNIPSDYISTLEWGTTSSYGDSISVNDNTTMDHLNKYTIDNLTPNTKYYYKVSSTLYNHEGNFISAPSSPTEPLIFYANGNKIHRDNNNSETIVNAVAGQMLNQIVWNPSSQTFLVQTDGFVSGDHEEMYRDEYFKSTIFGDYLKSMLPIVGGISKGERDTKCLDYYDNVIDDYPADAIGNYFHKYFPYNYANPNLNSNNSYEFNHSFDYGPVHISFPEIEFQATLSSDAAITFLNQDLTNSNKEWKVLSFNVPLKSLNGDILNSSAYASIRQLAIDKGVQLVLMGQENYYSHWVDDGIHFMILGDHGMTSDRIRENILQSENEIMAATVPHFAKFKIDGDMMFIDIIQGADYNGYQAGRIIEQFAIPKQRNIISSNTIWESDADHPIIMNGLQIQNNATLELKSKLILTQGSGTINNSTIIVQPGSCLLMQSPNATVTGQDSYTETLDMLVNQSGIPNFSTASHSEDKKRFYGVQLKSSPNLNQELNENTYATNQGLIVMKNGATIENAICGIEALTNSLTPGISNKKFGGGLALLYDANILNCITGVRMYPYEFNNTLNKVEKNKSRFIDVNFKTDNNWIDPDIQPIAFVDLRGVKDVKFKACNFENIRTNQSIQDRGDGIRLLDASIVMGALCTSGTPTCTSWNRNTFINTNYGVRASMVDINKQITIDRADFENVYHGIHVINSHAAAITRCSLEVAELNTSALPMLPYGIHIDGGKAFKVQDNQLETKGAFNGVLGIVIDNTGSSNSEIYNNDLEGFNVAIEAIDDNRGNNNDGLKFFCNENNNPVYDIWVTDGGVAEVQQYSGVNSIKFPAGNIFSSTNRTLDYDFSNINGQGLDYYNLINASQKEKPTNISNIICIDRYTANQCLSKVDNGSSLRQLLLSEIDAQMAFNSSHTILRIWRNGGNANLDEYVATVQPWDVYIEFNSLLAESPYVGDEVLIAVAQNLSFTNLMVKLLCVANPHSARNEELMDNILEFRPTFPQAYINEILAEESTTSQLQLLENDVASDQHQLDEIETNIELCYRRDSVNAWTGDSLLARLSRKNTLVGQYRYAQELLHRNDYATLNTCLQNIESEFEMNEEEAIQYTNYVSLFGIAEYMNDDELYSDGLSDSQRTSLIDIVDLDEAQTSAFATALLMLDNPDMVYYEEVVLPSSNSARKSNMAIETKERSEDKMVLYPNPAFDYVTVNLQLSQEYSNLQLNIYDEVGKLTLSRKLSENEIEIILDLSSLSIGSYSVQLLGNDCSVDVQKLNVIK